MANCVVVGAQDRLATRQRHHEGEDGAARHMEVGDHRVDALEAKARTDEQSGEALGIAGDRPRFERPRTASTHADHATADTLRKLNRSDGRGRDRIPLGFHRVLLDCRRAYRREGPGPDMERKQRGTNSGRGEFAEQRLGEVQSRGRRRYCARRIGIDGLIIGGVAGVDLTIDIVRQRQHSGLAQKIFHREPIGSRDERTPRALVSDHDQHAAIGQQQTSTFTQRAMGSRQRDPGSR